MNKSNILQSSFIRWTDLKAYFISPDDEDFETANGILDRFEVDADKLEEIIQDLNSSGKNWHFYLQNCRIKRAPVHAAINTMKPI